MNATDTRKKSIEELNVLLREKQDELRKLRFKDSERQLKSVRQIRKVRKEIAQIRTIIDEKKRQSRSA